MPKQMVHQMRKRAHREKRKMLNCGNAWVSADAFNLLCFVKFLLHCCTNQFFVALLEWLDE